MVKEVTIRLFSFELYARIRIGSSDACSELRKYAVASRQQSRSLRQALLEQVASELRKKS